MATETRPDAELATAWAAGDRSAFAAVYDRYASDLYAFALSRLRDRAAAGDAVQDTFLRAAPRIGQLRDPSRLRAWLYAIARNQVIDAVRRPTLLADTTELADMTADQPDPADAAAAQDAAALVRDAALGLTDRDQELLDLYLRHGLEGGDLADVVGMTRPQTYVAMNRLKTRLAKAVGTVLIARHGSKDCTELAALLGGWDGRFDLDVRSKVTRHVESCSVCKDRRAALIATVNLSVGAFAVPLAAPVMLRDATIAGVARLGEAAPVVPRHAALWRADGFPAAVGAAHRRRTLVAVLVTAALVAALITGFVVVRRDGGSEQVATAAMGAPPPSTAMAPTAASPTEPSATPTTTTAPPPSTAAVELPPPLTIPATTEVTVATTLGSLPAGAAPAEPDIAMPTATAPAPSAAPPPQTSAAPAPQPSDPPVPETTIAAAEPPPPPPADPGRIGVLTGPITFGPSGTSGTIRIRNDGGQPAAWTATPALHTAFQVSPSTGALDPGAEADLAVSLDRASLGEGDHHTSISVGASSGGGAVQLIASVERAPTINAFARTPPVVRTSTACGPTLVSVVVNASDESPISSVVVQWSADGSFAQLTTLAQAGGGAYTGAVGGFVSPGVHSLKAIVTDARGNSANQTTTVTATTC